MNAQQAAWARGESARREFEAWAQRTADCWFCKEEEYVELMYTLLPPKDYGGPARRYMCVDCKWELQGAIATRAMKEYTAAKAVVDRFDALRDGRSKQ